MLAEGFMAWLFSPNFLSSRETRLIFWMVTYENTSCSSFFIARLRRRIGSFGNEDEIFQPTFAL